MNEEELTELAARVGKYLKWEVFLLGAGLLVLGLGLLMQRSISRQAVTVSQRINGLNKMADNILSDLFRGVGDGPGDSAAGDAGPAGDVGVAGDAGMAAGNGAPVGEAPGAPAARAGGARKRPPRDGGRAGRAAGGS